MLYQLITSAGLLFSTEYTTFYQVSPPTPLVTHSLSLAQNPYGPVPPGPVPLPMAALPPPGGGGPYPYPPPSGHVPYLPPLPGGAAVHQVITVLMISADT